MSNNGHDLSARRGYAGLVDSLARFRRPRSVKSQVRQKILIVEDAKDIVKLLLYNFHRAGYHTAVASEGAAGLRKFHSFKPDLVILDIMLPRQDGLEVCRTIRAHSQVPILMLTAKKEEVDRILGLEIGADDYVTKPFSVRELLARIKGILRRVAVASEPSLEPGIIRYGEFEMSLERYEVTVKRKIVPLTTKEFELLRTLAGQKNKVYAREELLALVWGTDQGGLLDTRTVDQHMARLRKKLGSEQRRLLTVKNRGYRFDRR